MRIRGTAIATVTMTLAMGVMPLVGQGSSVAAAVTRSCAPTQMSVAHGQAQGTAGTTYVPLVFTNHGATCALWGAPTIQPVNASRRAVGPSARNESIGEMPVRHVLSRGQSVSVAFGVADTGNFPVASCAARPANGVVVALAPFVRSTYVRLPISVCTKQASTTTRLIVAGVNGD